MIIKTVEKYDLLYFTISLCLIITFFCARRWELSATEKLSDSLKICFVALYDITNEISYKVYKRTGWNPIDSLKKAVYILTK